MNEESAWEREVGNLSNAIMAMKKDSVTVGNVLRTILPIAQYLYYKVKESVQGYLNQTTPFQISTR